MSSRSQPNGGYRPGPMLRHRCTVPSVVRRLLVVSWTRWNLRPGAGKDGPQLHPGFRRLAISAFSIDPPLELSFRSIEREAVHNISQLDGRHRFTSTIPPSFVHLISHLSSQSHFSPLFSITHLLFLDRDAASGVVARGPNPSVRSFAPRTSTAHSDELSKARHDEASRTRPTHACNWRAAENW